MNKKIKVSSAYYFVGLFLPQPLLPWFTVAIRRFSLLHPRETIRWDGYRKYLALFFIAKLGFNTPTLWALQKNYLFDTPSACGGVVHCYFNAL